MTKKHKKLYKAGKNWVVATLTATTITLLGGIGAYTAHADATANNSPQDQQVLNSPTTQSNANQAVLKPSTTQKIQQSQNRTDVNTNSSANTESQPSSAAVDEHADTDKTNNEQSMTEIRDVTRTVKMEYFPAIRQTVRFTRSVSTDQSGKKVYGEWKLVDGEQPVWPEIDVPKINDRYTETDKVPQKVVTPDTNDEEIGITYYEDGRIFGKPDKITYPKGLTLKTGVETYYRTITSVLPDGSKTIYIQKAPEPVNNLYDEKGNLVAGYDYSVDGFLTDWDDYSIPQIPGYKSFVHGYVNEDGLNVAGQYAQKIAGSNFFRNGLGRSAILNVNINISYVKDHQDSSKTSQNKTIARNIIIIHPDGTQTSQIQEVHLVRSVQADDAGGYIYGEWHVDQNSPKAWSNYAIPQLSGYDSYANGQLETSIPEVTVDGSTNDAFVIITYTRQTKAGQIQYVDPSGQVVKSDQISGKVGDQINVNLSLPDGYELANKDEQIPSSITVGEDGINTITIQVKKLPVVQTGSINYVDQNGKTVKIDKLTGKVGDQINVNLSLPDGYELANKDEQIPSSITVGEDGINTITIQVKKLPVVQTGSINYVDQNGKTVKIDKLTGKVGDTIKVTLSLPDGYELANKDEHIPSTITVGDDGINTITIQVKKLPVVQTGSINYVDQNGKTVKIDKLTGKVGDTIKVTLSLPDGYELANKDEHIPSTITVGDDGINTITIQVKKLPVVQTGSINYVDQNGKTVKIDKLTGKVGDQINVNLSLPDGYELANKDEQIPSSITVGEDGINTITIQVKKLPVVQTGSINYVDQNGKTVKIDKLTGKVGDQINVNLSLPDGYELANKDEQIPSSITVGEDGINTITIQVKKLPVVQTGSINYVDQNGKTVKIDKLTGKVGDTIKVTLSLPDGYELANKDEHIPSTITVGDDGINTITIQVKKLPVVQTGSINYVDQDGKVIKTDTISGKVGDQINVKLSLPDGYELTNKDEQVPSVVTVTENGIGTININVKKINTTLANNEVPYDSTTVSNNVNANYGYLDSYKLTENNQGQAQLIASGWHATGASNSDRYRYMIVFDNTLGHEIARQKLVPQVRSDVQRAYPNVDNSLYSGFNITIDIPNSCINHSLRLVSRYSNDPNNGEGARVDYWFNSLALNEDNQAYLDKLSANGDTLTVTGWHASNQAAGRPYHYIIAWDQNLGHEIARQKVNPVSRPDVANAYSTVANAVNSGFSVKFNLTPEFFNDNIQFISRWTDDTAGNGNAVDYWFKAMNRENRANLDSVTLSNGQLQVAGWHATDLSQLEPNHYLIVFDNTTGQQVASEKVGLQSSQDVKNAFGDIQTANHSRFNYTFNSLHLIPGHNYSLVSRYSVDSNGNGNDGAHTDSWLNMGTFQQSAYSIDHVALNRRHMTVQGWLANDNAMTKPYAYAILIQNGREIGRQRLTLSERGDVAKVYPQIYRSQYSGFNANFDLPTFSTRGLQLVLRFTDDPAGNGNSSDNWINL